MQRVMFAAVAVLAALDIAPAIAQTLTPPPNGYPTLGRIVREHPKLDELIARDARIEVLAMGLEFSEGPVWDRKNNWLLLSDIPRNAVMKWTHERGLELFMKPSGYTGVLPGRGGSNGLLIDGQGRLVLCEGGDRRLSRVDTDGSKVTLADRYDGKRFNQPNDVTMKSNGDLYFTDPLVLGGDPHRELDFSGVYRWSASTGQVTLLTKDMSRPNGIAFSPDEKTLYVSNSDAQRRLWMAFPVNADGTIGKGRVFAELAPTATPGWGPDGFKVDRAGNLWAGANNTGVLIYAPDGTRLGRIETGERMANVAFGDDGSVLYITADMYLLRVKTLTRGW